MRVEDCFLLGRILKPHSIHGESKVYLDVDYIEDYEDLESVYVLRDNKLTPFFIENLRIQGPNQAIVHFRGIDDRNQAEEFAGLELYLPEDELPELDEDQFYFHEVKGYTIEDARHGTLGQVLKVEEYPAQAVIVMRWQGREVLIPIAGDIVGNVDREKRILYTQLPDGLLEVYLSPNAPDDE